MVTTHTYSNNNPLALGTNSPSSAWPGLIDLLVKTGKKRHSNRAWPWGVDRSEHHILTLVPSWTTRCVMAPQERTSKERRVLITTQKEVNKHVREPSHGWSSTFGQAFKRWHPDPESPAVMVNSGFRLDWVNTYGNNEASLAVSLQWTCPKTIRSRGP